MDDLLANLVSATATALDDRLDPAAVVDAVRPALAAVIAEPSSVPAEACESYEGQAVGNLVHADPDGRFHVLAVVFPEGTSSGIHEHGCWGVIGYVRGGDEETRYRAIDEGDGKTALEETARRVWRAGDIAVLLPPADGWHRVRSTGPGDGVSLHVLCRSPAEHPHFWWDRETHSDAGRSWARVHVQAPTAS